MLKVTIFLLLSPPWHIVALSYIFGPSDEGWFGEQFEQLKKTDFILMPWLLPTAVIVTFQFSSFFFSQQNI